MQLLGMISGMLSVRQVLCGGGVLAILLSNGCVWMTPVTKDKEKDVLIEQIARPMIGKVKVADILASRRMPLVKRPMTTHTIRDLVKKTSPSVVSIYVKTSTPHRARLLPVRIPGGGFRVNVPGEGLGSGFFISSSGFILTNEHVIEHAKAIRVKLLDGSDFPARVVARWAERDLALMKVDAKRPFKPIPMGSCDLIEPGDMVIALGNPLGLGHTATLGVISQTERDLSKIDKETPPVAFIQTDAAINPGSSGGALVTMDGTWVGVNTASFDQAQNIGFSVPSKEAIKFLKRVLSGDGKWAEQ